MSVSGAWAAVGTVLAAGSERRTNEGGTAMKPVVATALGALRILAAEDARAPPGARTSCVRVGSH